MWNFLIPAIMGLGSALGGAAKSSSQSRQNEANWQADRDRTETSQYGVNQGAVTSATKGQEQALIDRALLELKRRQFGLDAPGQRMTNSAKGSMLANAQDVQVSGVPSYINVPTITGGRRPSALTPESRQLGALIARQSLMDQMSGDKFEDVPMVDWQSSVLQKPGTSQYPKAGAFEKIAGTAGLIGSGLEAVMNKIQQYQEGKPTAPGGLTAQQGGWTPPTFG